MARDAGYLKLSPVDSLKYFLSYYLSRRAFLRAIAPRHFRLKLPDGAFALVRPNGVDYKTLTDVFGRRLYEVSGNPPARIMDLGTNVGMATLFFSKRFPRAEFVCVEPAPSNVAQLRSTLALNRIRATVFEGAIAPSPGAAELDIGYQADNFSFKPANPTARTLPVRLFSVPEILSSVGWQEIDLLKIDIEGYEAVLLAEKNGWLRQVKVIVGEVHGHVGYDINGVKADLEPLGFEVIMKGEDRANQLTIFEARRQSL